METLRTKRKRSENWESDEKLLLQRLIAEYIEIVEDKRTDSRHSQGKREAWAHILKRFNAVNKRKRELNQLHFQWRNTKFRLKAKGFNLQYKLRRDINDTKPAHAKDQSSDVITPKEEFEAAEYDICENDLQDNQGPVFGVTSSKELSCSGNTLIKNEPILVSSDEESSLQISRPCPTKSIPALKTKYKRVNTKDEPNKNKLFLRTKKLKENELRYIEELHAAKITSIEMERDLKLCCMQEEHNAKIKMLNRSKYTFCERCHNINVFQ